MPAMNKIKFSLVNESGFPKPRKVKCFKCKKIFGIKYVVPNKGWSKKNNWEYWSLETKNPNFWEDKEARKKDRQICNSCLLKIYYNKEIYWGAVKDLKKRRKLATYIYEGKFLV